MATYGKTTVVNTCIYGCDFYSSTSDGMECGHPYFDDKNSYDRMIIDRTGKIPEKCPLRKEELIITCKYSLRL